jgi:hypothetical protein
MSEETTVIPAPEGSTETQISPTFGPILVGSSILDGLTDGQTSAPMQYVNISGQALSYVEIILNPLTPVDGGTVQLVAGSSAYEFTITATETVARRILFVDIPSAFLSSFSVKNCSGDSFAAKGNTVIVGPQY